MEHPSGNAHATGLRIHSEHTPEEAENPHPGPSPSHDHGRKLCCHDNLSAAFYGVTNNGKNLVACDPCSKVSVQLLLPSFACVLRIDLEVRRDRLRTLPVAFVLSTPSLYRLSTSLLL